MAIFRLPLVFNRNIQFYKLLGCGKNGSFDIHPDWRQWAVLTVAETAKESVQHTGKFLQWWWQLFHCEILRLKLLPIEGHGTWDGKLCFGNLPPKTEYKGPIAILTRATIHSKKVKRFWQHVDAVSAEMKQADGFITSVGIGEMPWFRGATLSVWQTKAQMRAFAYTQPFHKAVIVKTRKENWYAEDMFVRFIPLQVSGTLQGIDPFKGKLYLAPNE
ncbi:DUF3291 domain-containing protein [Hydrotalea flava]|uniref:DUF3291 domain-containing protein n=1 Tax=Hydrotalea flava TaxID=714549 RepID=UPI0020A3ADB0|nr:DUF3291 domain-containing protein [Hydrotalea flava]